MHKVTLRPTGQVVEVDSDKTLLDSLKDLGLYISSSCGGHASCSDCIVKIIDGEDYVNTPPFPEVQLMGNVFHITKERLSCQTYITGDVTIDISNHDKSRVDERLNKKGRGFLKNRAPVNTKVRKKEDVEKMYTERQAIRDEKREKDGQWQKHWEKEKDALAVKKLGGGKRPKLFRTDHIEEAIVESVAKAAQKREESQNERRDDHRSERREDHRGDKRESRREEGRDERFVKDSKFPRPKSSTKNSPRSGEKASFPRKDFRKSRNK